MGMMKRRSLASLLFALGLLAGCNRSTPTSKVLDPSALLQNIPEADPKAYAGIDVHAWKNPYLIVKPDGIAILDIADSEERLIKPEELPHELAKLPQSAWPYGRVVSATMSGNPDTEDGKATLRKNRALVSGTLKDLHIYINWVSSS
jgi:hypothetical protein